MNIKSTQKQKIILIDFSLLISLLVGNFIFQIISVDTKAKTIISIGRNYLLMEDYRTFNQNVLTLLVSSELISAQVDGKGKVERDRKYFEIPSFDFSLRYRVIKELDEGDVGQIKVIFIFSILNGISLVFILWFSVNALLFAMLPVIKKQVEVKIAEDQKRIYFEELVKLSRQVAHDIRAPLSAFDIVLRGLEIPEDKRIILNQASLRIKGIAEDLLGKSRNMISTESKIHQKNNTTSLASDFAFLDRIIEELLAEFSHANQKIKFSFVNSAPRVEVKAREIDLARVLSNFLTNAVEAIQLNERRTDGKIDVQINNMRNSVNVVIKDNGCGIPQEMIHKVGSPGYSYGKKNGNGLGVSFAIEKVTSWDGRVQFYSKDNEGTIVSILLKKRNSYVSF